MMRAEWASRPLRRWMQVGMIACLLVLALGAAPGSATVAEDFTFGLHVADPEGVGPVHMEMAGDAGAEAVTVSFRWEQIEPEPGRFNWEPYDTRVAAARAVGMRVIGVLPFEWELPLTKERRADAGWPSRHQYDWTFFVSGVVSRFAKQVDAWVVEGGPGWGGDGLFAAVDAELHADFTALTADAIRKEGAVGPVLVTAPVGDLNWLQMFGHLGGLDAVDGLALDVNRWPAAPFGLSVVVGDVRALLQEMDKTLLLWAWKFGYPTHRGVSLTEPRLPGVTYDEQAKWLVQSHVLLASAGVSKVVYNGLIDGTPDEGAAADNFGLYKWIGEPKPSVSTYKTMVDMLRGLHYARPGDVIERPVVPVQREVRVGQERGAGALPSADEPGLAADGLATDGLGADGLGAGADGDDPWLRWAHAQLDEVDAIGGTEEPGEDGEHSSHDYSSDEHSLYHFVFDYERFAEDTRDDNGAVAAHVLTGEQGTVIVLWTEPVTPTGSCRFGCGVVDILRWLDGVPVRAFDVWGDGLEKQEDMKPADGPLYIELPMELVP